VLDERVMVLSVMHSARAVAGPVLIGFNAAKIAIIAL
jgi:hypothetical protein